MIPGHINSLNPFIAHGTSVNDVLSILEKGLWSKSTLSEKKITTYFPETPYVQQEAKMPKTVSVLVYHQSKEAWSEKEARSVKIGNLTDNERLMLVLGVPWTNTHIAYDFCFVFPKESEILEPEWLNFPYERLMNEPGELNSNNCTAVVTNEKALLENSLDENIGRVRRIISQVETILTSKNIEFLKEGWK